MCVVIEGVVSSLKTFKVNPQSRLRRVVTSWEQLPSFLRRFGHIHFQYLRFTISLFFFQIFFVIVKMLLICFVQTSSLQFKDVEKMM